MALARDLRERYSAALLGHKSKGFHKGFHTLQLYLPVSLLAFDCIILQT